MSREVVGRSIEYSDAKLAEVLSPEYFVRVRTTPGGPAPSETARAIKRSRDLLRRDDEWVENAAGRLRDAERRLREAAAGL